MNNKNQSIINELFDRTNLLFNLLKMQAAQEEIYFLPLGILLMKWIHDSRDRFNWNISNEYKNILFDSEYYHRTISFENMSKNIYRMGEEFERNNPILNGIFTSLCFPYIDYVSGENLRNIFITYNEFDFNDSNSEKNVTGPFIELFLYKLSNDSSFYEFITPKSIRQILVKLFNIEKYMNIADIACGTGGILGEVVKEYNSKSLYSDSIKLYGQDINSKVTLISKINLLLHGIDNPNIIVKDTLKDAILYRNNETNSFDIILSNLPLGVSWNINEICSSNDFKYGFPNSKMNADWIFIQRGVASLKSNGRAAFIVSKGTLIRNSEINIRKQILKDDIIEAVISLPSNLYGSKSMPIEILVINKAKEIWKKDRILYIDASKDFYKKERGKNDLANSHIEKILQVYHSYAEIDDFSKIIDNSMIEKQNFNLDSSFYVSKKQLSLNNKMKKLKEIAEVKRGLQLLKEDADKLTSSEHGSHYYIKISDIVNGKIEFNERIKDLPENKIATYELKPGDIIISARGTLIKTAIYEAEAPPSIISGNIMVIRVKLAYNPYFLKFYLDSSEGKEQIQAMQGGSTITALNHSKIQELLVPDIDLEIQNRLAEKITENEKSYKSIIEHAKKMYEQSIEIINKEIIDFIEE